MNKFKKWIFDTFYEDVKYAMSVNEQNYKSEIRRIKDEYSEKTALCEAMHRALAEKGKTIVGIDENKAGEQVLIVRWLFGNDIWFMLYSKNYMGDGSHPRIMATLKDTYLLEQHDYKYHIRIDDIQQDVEDINKGNGSILMKHFLDYCKTTKAEYIDGWLSGVDKDHFDRSEHYYKKFGFEVSFNEDRSSGSIHYDLLK